MSDVKPWHVLLFVAAAAVLVVVFRAGLFGKGIDRTPDEVVLIDVISGDRFYFDSSGRNSLLVPARHPETNELTLLPAWEDDEGNWHVAHLGEITDLTPEEMTAVVDAGRGLVRVSDASPRKLSR